MKRFSFSSIIIFVVILFFSCKGTPKTPPVDLSNVDKQYNVLSIPFSELNGVKTIPVKLNGITLDMIYDTGCSGMHLSLNELRTLYKNGKFTEKDIIGADKSQIADGSIVENAVVIINEVEIGGEDGIILYDVKATVSMNQSAPVLLGNGVLDELASIEIDNINKIIKFTRY